MPISQQHVSWKEFCAELGKGPMYVRRLQSSLGLHIPSSQVGYHEAYLIFMHKIVSLRTFSVKVDDIKNLLKKEIKILELLHIDSMSSSPTWYLDFCSNTHTTRKHLLLTGYDLGFPINAQAVQSNLDFSERPMELFSRREIGEDIIRILRDYMKLRDKVRQQVDKEKLVLSSAISWASDAFLPHT